MIHAALLLATLGSFQAGVEAYHQGEFDVAARTFTNVIAREPTAGAHYNAGNALARLGRWPEALAQYRSAQNLTPRDPDLLRNIETARTELKQAPPSSRWAPGWLHDLLRRVTLTEALSALAAWMWGFLLLTLARSQLDRKPWGVLIRSWLLLLVPLAGVSLQRGIEYRSQFVIVTTDSPATSEPVAAAKPLFTIPPGSELRISSARADWVEVMYDRQRVWLPETSLTRIQ